MTPPSCDDETTPGELGETGERGDYEGLWETLMMRVDRRTYGNPYGFAQGRAVRVGMRPGIVGPYPKPNVKPPPPPPPR